MLNPMEKYDVIIAGAGPAGGQCARMLSGAGKKVLLAERNKDFTVNNYSSAGAPLEIMETFHLPENIIGTSWNKIAIYSTNNQVQWETEQRKGVIFDFMKLRSFLANEAVNAGGTLKLNLSYLNHHSEGNLIEVNFKDTQSREIHTFHTKVLVDATGCERQILEKNHPKPPSSFPATGIEYLVETTPENYKKYAQALSIFIGLKWMPQGYAWIFPMAPNLLKMGVGRYFQNSNYVPYHKSYHYYLNHLITETLGDNAYTVVDKHGKTIVYTYGQKDLYCDKNVIAIGDAVSSINPLAFEGIRHAMHSGQIAAKHIQNRLEEKCQDFKDYQKEMVNYCRLSWKISEWLMNIIYRQPDDKKNDLMVEGFKSLSMDDMMELAFHYKLEKAVKFMTAYGYAQVISKIGGLAKK